MNHLDYIRDTLMHARLCHEAWWIFKGTNPEREMIKSVYNRYLEFFATVRPALYTTFVVKLATLFGTGSGDITFKLIPEVEKEPSFTELWDRGRQLYKVRNKLIAHRDRKIGDRDFALESGLTYADLKAILDDACGLFDSYAQRLKIPAVPKVSCESDLLRLMNDLYTPIRT